VLNWGGFHPARMFPPRRAVVSAGKPRRTPNWTTPEKGLRRKSPQDTHLTELGAESFDLIEITNFRSRHFGKDTSPKGVK